MPKRRQTTFPVIAEAPLPATQTHTHTQKEACVFLEDLDAAFFVVFFLSHNLLFGSLLSASRLKRRSHSIDLSRILLSAAPRAEWLE